MLPRAGSWTPATVHEAWSHQTHGACHKMCTPWSCRGHLEHLDQGERKMIRGRARCKGEKTVEGWARKHGLSYWHYAEASHDITALLMFWVTEEMSSSSTGGDIVNAEKHFRFTLLTQLSLLGYMRNRMWHFLVPLFCIFLTLCLCPWHLDIGYSHLWLY